MRALAAFLFGAAMTANAATTAFAEDYRDVAGNFRVTVPEAWRTMKPDNPVIKLLMASPRIGATLGVCAVLTQPEADTQGLTQAEIDAKLGVAIDENFWRAALMMSPGVEDAKLTSSSTDKKRGRQVYSAVMGFTLNIKVANQDPIKVPTTGKQLMIAIPGQVFIVTCTARNEGYQSEESDFDIVFDSFEPLGDGLSASNETRGAPSLTLYSLARFGGASHVVTQNTPDLALHGWRSATASVSVGGGASWELCDGADYTGKCRIVNGVLPSGLGTAVASARRLSQADSKAALARIIQGDIASAIAGTAQWRPAQ